MKTKLYGASDDLIEIDGAISDETDYPYGAKKKTFLFSDRTSGNIAYNGNWHIQIDIKGDCFDKIINGNPNEEPHTDDDAKNCSPYSDVLIMKEGIEWVVIGKRKFHKS